MVLRERRQRSLLARASAWWRNLGGAPATLARGFATAALVLAFAALSLGGGALVASARSLPGDVFYPVKLVREKVQLWLTFDNVAKEDLRDAFEERRIAETKSLLEERRAASVAFTGTLDIISDTVVVIGGVTVTLPSDVTLAPALGSGAEVKVEAWTQPDGSVLARRIEIESDMAAPTAVPTSSATVPAVVNTDTPLPAPTNTPVGTATAIPTETQTAEPTKTPIPPDTASPTPSRPCTSTAEPTSTRTRTRTLTPSATSTATATPTQPRVIKLQFSGSISQIGQDSWQVGGETVLVTAETVIDKRGGPAEVGAWARVTAVRRDSDGALVALEIVIERPAAREPEVTEFQGLIESFTDAAWVVSGQAVRIAPDTTIEGTPVVGRMAAVRAKRFQDGPWTATHIRVLEPEIVVQFEGAIQSFSATEWVVEGRAIKITAETAIEGAPAVGRLAEVEAVQKADGTLVARWIRVSAEPEPSPTVALVPATPTPAPTQGTAVTPEPSPLPTETAISQTQPTLAAKTPGVVRPRPTSNPIVMP